MVPRAGASVRLAVLATAVGLLLVACGSDDEGEAPVTTVAEGDAALVEGAPDGAISKDEITEELERSPSTRDLAPGTAEYDQAVEGILDELILTRWFEAEGAELGLSVSDAEVDDQLATTIDQQLGGEQGFERFLEQQGFTEDEVRERIRLQILSQKIQDELAPDSDSSTSPGQTDSAADRELQATVEDFFDKWRARTICAEDLLNPRCSNAPESEQEPLGQPAPE